MYTYNATMLRDKFQIVNWCLEINKFLFLYYAAVWAFNIDHTFDIYHWLAQQGINSIHQIKYIIISRSSFMELTSVLLS